MANACRWLARSLAVLSVVLALAFAIGEHPPGAVTLRETILLGLFFAALIGNLAAWRWEGAGAALALSSGAAFALLEWGRHGRLPGPWIMGVLLLPGVLYAASQILRRLNWHRGNGP